MPELIHNVWEVLRVDLVELPLHRWAAEQKLYLAHTVCPFVPGGGLVKNDVLVEGLRCLGSMLAQEYVRDPSHGDACL